MVGIKVYCWNLELGLRVRVGVKVRYVGTDARNAVFWGLGGACATFVLVSHFAAVFASRLPGRLRATHDVINKTGST